MTIQLTINFRAVFIGIALLAVLAFSTPFAISLADDGDVATGPRAPLGNAFTFQGRLELDGVPVTGARTLRFTLRSDAVANTTVGSPQTQALTVTDGQFAAMLDFGVNAFDGQARWVDVEVETSPGNFALLPPRQPLTATPYALFALKTAPHNHLGESWSGNVPTGLTVTTTAPASTVIQATNSGNCNGAGLVCYGVWGKADAFPGGSGFGGVGVRGDGTNAGILGIGPQFGVYGSSASVGVQGYSEEGDGVFGISGGDNSTSALKATALNGAYGVRASAQSGIGVSGESANSTGVFGEGNTGIQGYTNVVGGLGIHGVANVSNGVAVLGFASGSNTTGVKGTGTAKGVWGSSSGWAGYFDGGVYSSTGVFQGSDLRLKHSVRDLESALSTVMALRPVRYEYNERPGEHIGLIAQEVQGVLPELVTVNLEDEGMLSLNYTELIPVLIAAVQEQQAQIAALRAAIE